MRFMAGALCSSAPHGHGHSGDVWASEGGTGFSVGPRNSQNSQEHLVVLSLKSNLSPKAKPLKFNALGIEAVRSLAGALSVMGKQSPHQKSHWFKLQIITRKKFWMLVEEKQKKQRNKDTPLCFSQGIISEVQNSPGHAGPLAKGNVSDKSADCVGELFRVGGLSYHWSF